MQKSMQTEDQIFDGRSMHDSNEVQWSNGFVITKFVCFEDSQATVTPKGKGLWLVGWLLRGAVKTINIVRNGNRLLRWQMINIPSADCTAVCTCHPLIEQNIRNDQQLDIS